MNRFFMPCPFMVSYELLARRNMNALYANKGKRREFRVFVSQTFPPILRSGAKLLGAWFF